MFVSLMQVLHKGSPPPPAANTCSRYRHTPIVIVACRHKLVLFRGNAQITIAVHLESKRSKYVTTITRYPIHIKPSPRGLLTSLLWTVGLVVPFIPHAKEFSDSAFESSKADDHYHIYGRWCGDDHYPPESSRDSCKC